MGTALVAIATACGGGGEQALAPELDTTPAPTATVEAPTTIEAADAPTPAPTASATPVPPTPTATPNARDALEAAVLEAHAKYLQAIIDSGDPPDPNHPGLLRWATGDALLAWQERRRNQQLEGQFVAGSISSRPSVVDLSDDRAVVEDCLLDRAPVYTRSGQIVEPAPLKRFLVRTTIMRGNVGWQVVLHDTEAAVECFD